MNISFTVLIIACSRRCLNTYTARAMSNSGSMNPNSLKIKTGYESRPASDEAATIATMMYSTRNTHSVDTTIRAQKLSCWFAMARSRSTSAAPPCTGWSPSLPPLAPCSSPMLTACGLPVESMTTTRMLSLYCVSSTPPFARARCRMAASASSMEFRLMTAKSIAFVGGLP